MAKKMGGGGTLRVLGWILAGPWVVLWSAFRALRWIGLLVGHGLALRRAMRDELPCPAGHANSAVGRWECRCGFVFMGWAFAPCSNCGEPAGWFPCERCALGVRSPLV